MSMKRNHLRQKIITIEDDDEQQSITKIDTIKANKTSDEKCFKKENFFDSQIKAEQIVVKKTKVQSPVKVQPKVQVTKQEATKQEVAKLEPIYKEPELNVPSRLPSSLVYQAGKSYPIPLLVNTLSYMNTAVTHRYSADKKEMFVSRFKGDKSQFTPAILDFIIPCRGKHTLKMDIVRSNHYNIYFGITTVAAIQKQWQRYAPTPTVTYIIYKCAFLQKDSPNSNVENQVIASNVVKKIYTQMEMEVDMDVGRLSFYMKYNRKKRVTIGICKYLMDEAKIGEQEEDTAPKGAKRMHGLVPYVGFKYDYDQVKLFH